MNKKGQVYLIPNLLGGEDTDIIPQQTRAALLTIDHFIVENLRNARRFLVKMGIKERGQDIIDRLHFYELDKHQKNVSWDAFLKPAMEGKSMAMLSEAGCPAIADPGSGLVWRAHQKGIEVIPLVGPSSILLAMMASGMNGQNFAFTGYLPIQQHQRIKKIKQLEKRIAIENQTQIFIEAPYRNRRLLKDLLQHCHYQTRLCIAKNITLPDQFILSQTISEWKKKPLPELHKAATIFVLGK